MATPIKPVPILSGEIADEFVRIADEQLNRPRKQLSVEQEMNVREIVGQLNSYKPSWRN